MKDIWNFPIDLLYKPALTGPIKMLIFEGSMLILCPNFDVL